MKILYVTTIALTMRFFPEHIKMLQQAGNIVELATNTEDGIPPEVSALKCKVYHIPFSRNPLNKDNKAAYGKLKTILRRKNYDIVHTHTPNASVIVRFAARKLRKSGLKVLYTAHGFHFYKGAPLKNWLLFYPVEWLCAHWTDTLITINHEDYSFAKKHMHAKKVEYVPGVGLDLNRYNQEKILHFNIDTVKFRQEIGLSIDNLMLVSVGELNSNKNHEVVLRTVAELNDPSIHYVIAGAGEKKQYLTELAEKLDISSQLHLLGFRDDVVDIYHAADICCFPSIREGLGMAALEGMACGLPLIAADNRGTRSFCIDGENGFICAPHNVEQFKSAIEKLKEQPEIREQMGMKNIQTVKQFSTEKVLEKMKEIYFSKKTAKYQNNER